MTDGVYDRLTAHLASVQASPATTTLDRWLIDEAELVLPDKLDPQRLTDLVTQISSILQNIQQDPTPLTLLLEKLLHAFTFADVLSFEPPIDFASGLSPIEHMVPINMLMLYLLQKATDPADTATVAGWPEVVRAMIRLWLCTPDTGVASRAGGLLYEYLTVDRPKPTQPDQQLPVSGPGQGLMWRRLFSDRDVYRTLFECCDLASAGPDLNKRQITLAQARLLEWLPRWASLDWAAVSKSHIRDVEAAHGVQDGSLLDFSSLYMIDTRDDVLTHVCLLEFYTTLLETTKHEVTAQGSSTGLDYLSTNGIHQKLCDLYLNESTDDPFESMFLYGPASRYLAVYASDYQQHYMASQLPQRIQVRLLGKFHQSASRWSHGEPPKYDLHLLASLPRISLLSGGDWSKSPVLQLPSASAPPEVLQTLAAIFHGPETEAITFPPSSPLTDVDHAKKVEDAAAARALYFHYLARNRNLWKDVIAQAETVAMLDRALAALDLLTAVITANWSTEREFALPSDVIATPDSGVLAILSPPALEYVLPYLNRPAQTFSNLVGGRGDAESSAYKIAMAKFDALRAMHGRLSAHVATNPDPDLQQVLATLQKRLSDGALSGSSEVGGRISTLEL